MGSRKLHTCPKVTEIGSIIGHRIDYNEVGALRGQRHIPTAKINPIKPPFPAPPPSPPRVSWEPNFGLDETRIPLILSFRVILVSKTQIYLVCWWLFKSFSVCILQGDWIYMVLYDILIFWLNFAIGLNFIFLCFKLIIVNYRTTNQGKRKFKPMLKLNHTESWERALDVRYDETVKPSPPSTVSLFRNW